MHDPFDPGADRLGPQGDRFYAALLAAHDGLSETGSHQLNARLVLLMANAIGDTGTLEAILQAATGDRKQKGDAK